jgi:hypothetical protein
MTEATTMEASGTAQQRYQSLTADRQHFVDRAHRCAQLTLPTLFQRDASATRNQNIKDPYQSLGARGTNTLASKMVLSLLPMNTPFFKLNVDLLALKQDGQEELKTEIEKGLGAIERSTLKEIENSGDVTTVFEALKHLVVTGNVLVFVGEDGSRLYDLNKFVVIRTPEGEWTEIVIREATMFASLSKEQRSIINSNANSADGTVDVYTHVTKVNGRVQWHQEIEGQVVPGTKSDVPEKGNPWLALRFMRVDGESYGRGYVEMYLGDLESLDVLSKAMRDGAAAATKVLWLVRPNGTTNPKVVAQAPNNSVRQGDANDVTALQLDKSADLRVAQEVMQSIQSRLAYAFMINAEVLRDAERVTAEEVRFVAQELDDSLGGIYSILSKDFQMPYVKRRMHLLRKANKIPDLPPEVDTVIVTGFAALGRGHDRDKLTRFVKTLTEIYGQQAIGQYINADELNSRLAVADGIETQGLLITQAERNEMQQQGQQQQMLDKLGPEAIRQMGPMIQEQMNTQPPEGTPDGS